MSQKRRVHFVLSSHWDREWYQTFQDYRYRLVELFDHVLDGLETGRLKGPFTTDGQTVVIDDYLEVRPEKRAQVEGYLKSGQIVTGPWFDLPDEFLVSGESLLRNIRLGRQHARELGTEPSDAGWFCDLFGHNSQMPQILAGFNIRSGFLWRGVNNMRATQIWRGADGSDVLCHRFGRRGYCSYAFAVRKAGAGFAEHRADGDHPDLILAGSEEEIEAQLSVALEQYLQQESERNPFGPILLFDGGDHQGWDERAYRVLLNFMARPDSPYDFVHSSLDIYLEELKSAVEAAPGDVPVQHGELRDPGYEGPGGDEQWVIPGVLSSRVWIKQDNAHCQSLLCQWAEPFAALSQYAVGRSYPKGYLDVAWKWLMLNHPHDSICGCSIDQVHEDMKYRFSQTRQIADRLTVEATKQLTAAVEGEVSAEELRVGVFNPLPVALEETVELALQIPTAWPSFTEFFGFEAKPSFRIYDAQGAEIPYQRVAQAKRTLSFIDPILMPQGYETNEVVVSIPLRVPALGHTTLTIKSGQGETTRYPQDKGLATGEASMENENLRVQIESNGTLTLTDKKSGQVYERLLTFEDIADIGDGWYHGQAVNDQAFVSTGAQADVALVSNGPNLTAFRIRTALRVPREFDFSGMVRSDAMTEVLLDTKISLRPGSDRLEVETAVTNNAGDHRLRVLFPTGAATETYFSDTPFDVVERPIALRADNHQYRELEVEGKPQQSWSAVCDGARGLAVISDGGLLECAVRDLPQRPLALTLMRATRRTVMTSGEPNGQLQGTWKFRYAIAPFSAEAPDAIRLGHIAAQLSGGIRTAQLTTRDLEVARRGQKVGLAKEASLLELQGPALLSAAQMINGALEVRLYNPAASAVEAVLDVKAFAPKEAVAVDFESNAVEGSVKLDGNKIVIGLGAKKIVTVRIS